MRNRIKMFAQKKVTLPPGRHKFVILDEADSMTAAAQQALRRTMELYSATTRFALACNNSTKVIEPIQSRCAILRYNRLSDAELLARLQHVCAREGVASEDDGLEVGERERSRGTFARARGSALSLRSRRSRVLSL